MTCRARECRSQKLFACLSGLLGLVLIGGCGISSPTSSSLPGASNSSAASGTVTDGAQLGMAWSAADATLRPVMGVPGSAQFGASLVSAGSFSNAAFSAQSQLALLVDSKHNLYLLALPASQPTLVTQGMPANAAIVFSPLGGSAAIYAPGASAATVIGGLPLKPVISQVQTGTAIQAASISDAGTLALAAGASSSGVTITTIAAAGTKGTIATLTGFGGMTFLPASEDILLADSGANTLTRLHNGAVQTLATAKDGLNQPLAVAASLDSHWAVTANHANGTLVRIDLTAATPTVRSTCTCSPSTLAPLNGNAVFELTAPGTAATWMIEADDQVPRVLFIPPARHG